MELKEIDHTRERKRMFRGPTYFREAAEVIGAAGGGPPDRLKIAEVFRRHGMTVAEPSPGK